MIISLPFARVQPGDIKGAINDYRKTLELNPNDEATRNQLQVLLENSQIK